MTAKEGTFIFECPEDRCAESFELPAEVISTEPATRGKIVFTIRMSATNEEGERYKNHMMEHFEFDDNED